ncbi:TC3A transposase, partial [Pseudoatta argentina]
SVAIILWSREQRAFAVESFFCNGLSLSLLNSLRGDLPWPARSPDLSPCDFFLWGYLKSLVYVDRPRTIDHLKNNIRDAIANIPIDMLRRVDENFKERLNQCMRDGGRHLTDVIFKTV